MFLDCLHQFLPEQIPTRRLRRTAFNLTAASPVEDITLLTVQWKTLFICAQRKAPLLKAQWEASAAGPVEDHLTAEKSSGRLFYSVCFLFIQPNGGATVYQPSGRHRCLGELNPAASTNQKSIRSHC